MNNAFGGVGAEDLFLFPLGDSAILVVLVVGDGVPMIIIGYPPTTLYTKHPAVQGYLSATLELSTRGEWKAGSFIAIQSTRGTRDYSAEFDAPFTLLPRTHTHGAAALGHWPPPVNMTAA